MADVVERMVTVTGRLGLHGRPAAQLVHIAGNYKADLTIGRPGDEPVDCRSILSLLILAATPGTKLQIRGCGDDAAGAVSSLAAFFDCGFNEK